MNWHQLDQSIFQFWQYFNFLRLPALHEHEDWFLNEGTDPEYTRLVYQYYKRQLQILSYKQGEIMRIDTLRPSDDAVFSSRQKKVIFVFSLRFLQQKVVGFCSSVTCT